MAIVKEIVLRSCQWKQRCDQQVSCNNKFVCQRLVSRYNGTMESGRLPKVFFFFCIIVGDGIGNCRCLFRAGINACEYMMREIRRRWAQLRWGSRRQTVSCRIVQFWPRKANWRIIFYDIYITSLGRELVFSIADPKVQQGVGLLVSFFSHLW